MEDEGHQIEEPIVLREIHSRYMPLRNLDRGAFWVLDQLEVFCKMMGFDREGREVEILAFGASLEVNKQNGANTFEKLNS